MRLVAFREVRRAPPLSDSAVRRGLPPVARMGGVARAHGGRSLVRRLLFVSVLRTETAIPHPRSTPLRAATSAATAKTGAPRGVSRTRFEARTNGCQISYPPIRCLLSALEEPSILRQPQLANGAQRPRYQLKQIAACIAGTLAGRCTAVALRDSGTRAFSDDAEHERRADETRNYSWSSAHQRDNCVIALSSARAHRERANHAACAPAEFQRPPEVFALVDVLRTFRSGRARPEILPQGYERPASRSRSGA